MPNSSEAVDKTRQAWTARTVTNTILRTFFIFSYPTVVLNNQSGLRGDTRRVVDQSERRAGGRLFRDFPQWLWREIEGGCFRFPVEWIESSARRVKLSEPAHPNTLWMTGSKRGDAEGAEDFAEKRAESHCSDPVLSRISSATLCGLRGFAVAPMFF